MLIVIAGHEKNNNWPLFDFVGLQNIHIKNIIIIIIIIFS